LSQQQLQLIRPGFLRVEFLAESYEELKSRKKQKKQAAPPIPGGVCPFQKQGAVCIQVKLIRNLAVITTMLDNCVNNNNIKETKWAFHNFPNRID
jgi:hypothetical protein